MAVKKCRCEWRVAATILGHYQEIVNKAEGRDVPITSLERFAFYERAKKAYAVISTG
jgi:L-fucose mutarotase/ribose pyranase (RbsD/FucU family)